MAFTLATEDGLANANAYVAVADVDTYLEERGSDTKWKALSDDEAKKRLIVQATDYMDRRWGRLLVSGRLTTEQRLEWPRVGLGIPADIVEACIEYANYAVGGPLFLEYRNADQRIASTREQVGPFAREVNYEGGVSVRQTAHHDVAADAGRYPRADALMERYVRTSGGVIRA